MTLLASHLEDLRRSGLSDETIARAGIYSAPERQVRDVLGFGAGPGMVIPYPGANGPRRYVRVRLDRPDAQGKRYRSPAKVQNHLYVPPTLDPKRLADVSFPLYFTEGEKKTTATVSDGTNTYTQLDVASTPYQTTTFVAKNVAAGSYTVTATFSAADIARTIIAIEVAGADTVNPVGSAHKLGSQANPGTGTDAVTSGTVTVQTDSLVIGIVWHDTVAATWNLGTGFTQLFINEPSQNCCGFAAERKTHSGATGSDAATFTDSTDGMNEYRTAIIAFIPAATGGLFRNQGDLSGLGTGGKFRKGLDCRLERGRDYEYGDGVGVPLP